MPSSLRRAAGSQCAQRRGVGRCWIIACMLGCASVAITSMPAAAATPASSRPATSRSAKEEAIAGIPFDKLKADVRAKLSEVVDKPSIYRRLPNQSINCDPEMYLFLVRYPEVVVNIWELMGVTNVKLKRVGEYTFECSDGAGTVANVELVYGTRDLHLLYVEATYEGPLTGRKINGRGVMILRAGYKLDPAERHVVDNRLDVFIQLDQVGAELVVKTLQPLVGKAADINFQESATFVSRVNEAAQSNGPGVQRLAARLSNCAPDVREQFADVAAQVALRFAERSQSPTVAAPPAKTTPQVRR